MTKKLLAIAVAAGLAVPAAAMADATVYGKVHMSLDYVDTTRADSATDDTDDSNLNVTSNSSRLGLKGSEDLGGGLSAIWQYEVTVEVSDTKETFGGARNSYLGLKGGFGTLLVGRHDTPMKTVSRKYDLFGDQVGDSRNILSDSASIDGAGFDLRTQNTIAYVTPNLGAFSLAAAYVTDHESGGASGSVDNGDDDNNNDAMSINARFDGGMFDAMVGYEVHNIDDTGLSAAYTDSESAIRLAAGVDLDAFRVVALYQMVTDEGAIDGNDRTSYGLGGAFKMGGGNTVKAQYYVADESDEFDDNGASMIAVGFDHKFSKQTTGYVAYASTDNDDNASYVSWDGGHGGKTPVEAGETASVFSVGMIHKF